MGNPRKTSGGSWQYRFTVNGDAHSVTRRLKSDAVREGERLRDQLAAGYRPDTELTLFGLVDGWLRGRRDLAPLTIANYEGRLRGMQDHPVMRSRLVDVRPADLRRLVADLSSRLAPSAVGTYVVPIRSALGQAEEDMLILRSPWRGISLPAVAGTQVAARILSPEEFQQLYRAADELGFGLDVRLLVATGLRWGEYAGLETGDIGVGAVRICRTRLPAGDVGPPKSRRERTVPVAPDLLAALRGLEGPVLFRPADGVRWTYSRWRGAVWVPTLKASGLTGLRPHDLRHTAASWLLNRAGVDVKTVSTILGHVKLETTMRYLHTTPQHLTDAASAIGEMVA